MRTTINIEKARELGLPIPDGAAAMILYEVEPASDGASRACCAKAARDAIAAGTAALKQEGAAVTAARREVSQLRALLDSEQALRKRLEQELEDALAKLTEPPAKPKPVEPAESPIEKPKKKVNG